MTDPVIPPAAVEAAARAYWTNGGLDEDYSRLSPTARDALERATRLALEAALPHLRPLVEAQELRLATEVALKLGRQEAAEEIAQAFDREVELIESLPDDEGVRPQVRDVLRARRAAFRDSAHIARDTGKGESL